MAARSLTDGWTASRIAILIHLMLRLVLECTQWPVDNQ
jgi:hypothetical protein